MNPLITQPLAWLALLLRPPVLLQLLPTLLILLLLLRVRHRLKRGWCASLPWGLPLLVCLSGLGLLLALLLLRDLSLLWLLWLLWHRFVDLPDIHMIFGQLYRLLHIKRYFQHRRQRVLL